MEYPVEAKPESVAGEGSGPVPLVRPGAFADKLTGIAVNQLDASTEFKKDRMAQIRKYERLAAGKAPARLRVQYDAVLPVFAGMVDTLETEFDDPPFLKFKSMNAADYFSERKIQAAWENEAFSTTVNAQWPMKTRWGRHNAILSGRDILKLYAESDPEYQSCFDCVNYLDFHCFPEGGGELENHMYAGQEGVFKTATQLMEGARSGIYDRAQVRELLARSNSGDYRDKMDQDYALRMARFIDLGLTPEKGNFVGQRQFNLVEWVTEYRGSRYYVLFDPWTKVWVRFEKLTDLFSGGFFPWFSWATHENDKVFWSKSYGDDFYPSAMAIVDFVMQEYTARQKKLYGTKFYDPMMIENPAELNTAQYETDRLVEVTVPSGKSIKDAVYEIDVPELGAATIDLVSWIEATAARQSGTEDMSQIAGRAGGGKGPKANVVFAQIQAAQKRIGHKANSYSEAYSKAGTRYIQGLKDHFKGVMALKILGADGWETDELRRVDLNTKHALNIKVSSKREEDQENVFGKKQKTDAISLLIKKKSRNVNDKWLDEHILRDIGGFKEEDITEAMDTQNFADRATLAKAEQAIMTLVKGRPPLLYHRANTAFMEKIFNYSQDHKERLMKKGVYVLFLKYIDAHKMIVAENMAKLAGDINAGKKPMPGQGASVAGVAPGMPQPGQGGPQPGGSPIVKGAAGVPAEAIA